MTPQTGRWALHGAAGQGPERDGHKLQRTEKQLRACSIKAVGTLQGRCSHFYNRLKKMERKGEHLDYGCTFGLKNPSTRFFR